MAGTRFGALDLAAATYTVLMEGPAGFDSTVNVRFVNRNATTVVIRLAMVDDVSATAIASLTNDDFLEYDTPIIGNSVLENTGLVVPEGYSLVVRSDTTAVTSMAYGWAEVRI
jgi:hypothetical protein